MGRVRGESSNDLKVGNPLIEHRTCREIRGSRVNRRLRDLLLGINQLDFADVLSLEAKLERAGLTRHYDMFSLTEEAMESIGIDRIGHRMALLDLPFLALKEPFDYQVSWRTSLASDCIVLLALVYFVTFIHSL